MFPRESPQQTSLIKAAAAFNASFHGLYGWMSYWRAHSAAKVPHVLKVSQIMASNRSPDHKMTNSG